MPPAQASAPHWHEHDARRVTVPTARGPVAALQAGDGPVRALLLPGYTGSKEDFAPVLGPLAEAGIAVTAVDLPGQFESPGPDDPGAYTPDELALTVVEVAGRIAGPGGRVHLLGHSFGGLVARAAVITDAWRWSSLTLMCSGPAALHGPRRMLMERLEPVLAEFGPAAVHAASEQAARSRPGYVAPPAAVAQFLQRRFLAGPAAALQGMGRALRDEPDRVAELAARAPRTLVLHGADDDAWPPALQRDMAERLGAEVVVVHGAAHSPAVENPAPTAAALLRFWTARG